MIKSQIEIHNDHDFFNEIAGKVFHATTLENIKKIEVDGVLRLKLDKVDFPFGKGINGYFRSKGCVSFFDCRDIKKWETHVFRCRPTKIFNKFSSMSVLILKTSHHDNLISLSGSEKRKAMAESAVPDIEVGICGNVPLDYISHHIIVKLAKDHNIFS